MPIVPDLWTEHDRDRFERSAAGATVVTAQTLTVHHVSTFRATR
jgi:hypothetical protein